MSDKERTPKKDTLPREKFKTFAFHWAQAQVDITKHFARNKNIIGKWKMSVWMANFFLAETFHKGKTFYECAKDGNTDQVSQREDIDHGILLIYHPLLTSQGIYEKGPSTERKINAARYITTYFANKLGFLSSDDPRLEQFEKLLKDGELASNSAGITEAPLEGVYLDINDYQSEFGIKHPKEPFSFWVRLSRLKNIEERPKTPENVSPEDAIAYLINPPDIPVSKRKFVVDSLSVLYHDPNNPKHQVPQISESMMLRRMFYPTPKKNPED